MAGFKGGKKIEFCNNIRTALVTITSLNLLFYSLPLCVTLLLLSGVYRFGFVE